LNRTHVHSCPIVDGLSPTDETLSLEGILHVVYFSNMDMCNESGTI